VGEDHAYAVEARHQYRDHEDAERHPKSLTDCRR
jgi:hypothetical protein